MTSEKSHIQWSRLAFWLFDSTVKENVLKTSGWKPRAPPWRGRPYPTSQLSFLASWLYQPQSYCLHKKGSWPLGTGALQSLFLSNDDKEDVEAQDRKTWQKHGINVQECPDGKRIIHFMRSPHSSKCLQLEFWIQFVFVGFDSSHSLLCSMDVFQVQSENSAFYLSCKVFLIFTWHSYASGNRHFYPLPPYGSIGSIVTQLSTFQCFVGALISFGGRKVIIMW